MIKNIRKSVFETNSSSTHCVVIDTDINLISSDYKNEVSDDNKIHFSTYGEYGWSNDQLTSLSDKLSYIFSCVIHSKLEYIYSIDFEDKLEEKLNNRKTQILEIKNIFDQLNELVKVITGYEIYCEKFNNLVETITNETKNSDHIILNNDLTDGYVDHSGEKYKGIVDPLLNNQEDLKKFLFSNKSVLYTSNDNGG